MKKFLLMAAVASAALLADSQWASARRGGCGGGGRHGGGGCGMGCGGYGGGCGMMMGGGCGMMGGYGGHAMGGCGMGGCGGYAMGGAGFGGMAIVQAPSNEATLIVNLPEDATLTIDGKATTSTSAQRVFVTPALEDGKEYEYTLKAKVARDGKVQVATAKVTIRPGQTSQVELKMPAAGVAAQ